MATSVNATQSVQRALQILTTFTHETPRLRVNEIAKKLGLTPSTVSRHLSTMLDMGFVEREPETGLYYLGPEVITLAGVSLHSYDIYRHAYPLLWDLSLKTGLHCSLGIPHGGDIIHLVSVGSEETMDLSTPIGYHHPMFCCAIGRVILANLPPAKVQQLLTERPLNKLTPFTVTDITQLLSIINKIRAQGYAPLINELALGKCSIAAPIFGRHRTILGAVSLSGTIAQLQLSSRETELAHIITEAAGRISAKMGYFPK